VFASWQSQRYSIGGRDVVIRAFPSPRIDERFIADWVELEGRAADGNACLSPHFVLPALRYLDPAKRVVVLSIVRNDDSDDRLIGLGVFIARPPTRRFPLPHLEAYRSRHTFLTGMLLDQDCQWLALEGLAAYLSSGTILWSGLEFQDRLADSALDQDHPNGTFISPLRWSEYGRRHRAILSPDNAAQMHDAALSDPSLGEDLRRLERIGGVEFRVLVGAEVDDEAIDRFLRLGKPGWQRGDAEFFREMTQRFALAGRAVFCELMVNGRVIASSSNYVSGRVGFAFRIVRDPVFASAEPALLCELALMRWIGEQRFDLDYFDSGSIEASFIERLWKERREVMSGVMVGGSVGLTILPAIAAARTLKSALARSLAGS
jgi:hypothetical protein